jgi:ABC-2 type transport system permease protein
MLKKLYFSSLGHVIKREIRRMLNDWVLIFITLIAPMIAYSMLYFIFKDGVVRELPVTIVNLDNSALSRQAIRYIDATQVAHVEGFAPSVDEAHMLMDKGKTDAIVVIPSDFEKDVFKGNSPAIAVYINNTNVVKGGSLKSGIYTALSTLSTGAKIQTSMKKGQPAGKAFSQAMPIKTKVHMLFNPYTNYSYFLTLGLLPLCAIVFVFLGTAYAMGTELKEGTAGDLMKTANHTPIIAITGKLLPYNILFMANIMWMNWVIFKVFGTPLNGSLVMIIFSEFLLVAAYQSMAILFLNLTANLRLTLSLGSAYTMMALTFSGLTFPSFAMPLIAKIFGCIFPYTFWLKILMGQGLRGEPLSDSGWPLLILLGFVVTGLLALPGLTRKMSDEKYWYRQ